MSIVRSVLPGILTSLIKLFLTLLLGPLCLTATPLLVRGAGHDHATGDSPAVGIGAVDPPYHKDGRKTLPALILANVYDKHWAGLLDLRLHLCAWRTRSRHRRGHDAGRLPSGNANGAHGALHHGAGISTGASKNGALLLHRWTGRPAECDAATHQKEAAQAAAWAQQTQAPCTMDALPIGNRTTQCSETGAYVRLREQPQLLGPGIPRFLRLLTKFPASKMEFSCLCKGRATHFCATLAHNCAF